MPTLEYETCVKIPASRFKRTGMVEAIATGQPAHFGYQQDVIPVTRARSQVTASHCMSM